MAKLFLKFEQAVLKEIPLSQGVTTIGRLPDNVIQVDNLAVSGHHAKIYWDGEQYTLEDNGSLNGTYVNNQRITKHKLKNGDAVLIGKHSVEFKDEWHDDHNANAPAAKAGPAVPQMQATGMPSPLPIPKLDPVSVDAGTRTEAGPSPTRQYSTIATAEKTGTLAVLSGKTDDTHYVLTSKMSVIGKSQMASIKLKGWFAPKMAALISKRENAYFIAASEKNIKVKINGEEIAGQRALADGDVIEVAGIKMTFGFQT